MKPKKTIPKTPETFSPVLVGASKTVHLADFHPWRGSATTLCGRKVSAALATGVSSVDCGVCLARAKESA